VVWQFSAEDATVLAAGFTDLAGQLGTGGVGAGDPVAAVHSVLAAYPREWLLVFDNVPGPEQVQHFLPPAGHGRVLITSRNALWPPKQAVEVPVLDADAAAGFLVDRAGDPDERAARALAGELGGLPLALEQAAAYAQATGDSLAAYLALLRQRRGDLLARGLVSGYGGTVATTWALAFGQLQDSAPGAAGLLRLLACCAPEPVPLRLLLRPPPERSGQLDPEVAQVLKPLLDDELAAGDAVAALRRYSLVRPAGDGAASVHRLVQAVTAEQMPGQLREAWRQAAATLVEAVLPREPRQPDTWPVFAALLPHAQAVLPPGNPGMDHIVSYLGFSGGYAAAREFSQALAVERDRVLGPEHRDTLAARVHLAFWTGRAGDAAGARDQLAALLPIIERVLGPEDAYTLADRGILARFTGEAGDAAGARDQFAALLPIQEKVHGPEDSYTLTTRGKLAAYTGEAGDAAGARDQFAALLPIRERVLGPEHPSTLTTRTNLARFTGKAGDAAGARDQLAALLPIIERVLGPEHPDTLAARSNLAAYTGKAGDAAGARDQSAALLPIIERVLGPEHPDTLAARGNLARWTREAGDGTETGVN
jgi:Tetratricopeptide repeat